MSGFKPILVSLILAGLFAFSLLYGGYLLAVNNDASQSILDNPAMNSFKENLEDNLTGFYDTVNASETSFAKSPISLSQIVFVDALGGIWKTLKIIPLAIWNLIAGLVIGNLLTQTQFIIVGGVVGSLLIITIIFGVWKLINTGESEK